MELMNVVIPIVRLMLPIYLSVCVSGELNYYTGGAGLVCTESFTHFFFFTAILRQK